jgi:hypothetical protein
MTYGMKHGWRAIIAASFGLWLLAQFGLGVWVHDLAMALFGLKVPIGETGAFATFAWQFLWVLGLALGAERSRPLAPTAAAQAAPRAISRWVVLAAVVIGLIGFVWRHALGQAPFGADISRNLIFDKWQLGPLRLLNLFALVILALHFGPALARRMPRPTWLQTLGSASLPVFCAHLVMVLLVLSVWGGNPYARPWWGDVLLLAVCFAALTATAHLTLWLDRAPVVTRRLRGRFPRAELPPPLTFDRLTEPPPPAPPKETPGSASSPSARVPG